MGQIPKQRKVTRKIYWWCRKEPSKQGAFYDPKYWDITYLQKNWSFNMAWDLAWGSLAKIILYSLPTKILKHSQLHLRNSLFWKNSLSICLFHTSMWTFCVFVKWVNEWMNRVYLNPVVAWVISNHSHQNHEGEDSPRMAVNSE